MKAWPGAGKAAEKVKEAVAPRPTSGIETAVSALIMDFVKERELKRAQRPFPSEPSFESEKSHEHKTYNASDEIPPVYHS